MIMSMTGFGRGEAENSERKFTVEIKSVNHRYLDVSLKMPKSLSFFESAIRQEIKDHISRGKVDIFITYENRSENVGTLKCNNALAAEYLNKMRELSAQLGIDDDVRISSLARFPEVFEIEESDDDEEEIWNLLRDAVRKACEAHAESRGREGENLKNDLLAKLDYVKSMVDFIEERSPQIISEYRDRLHAKVQELLGDRQIDEGRILQEVTIYADKICVDEEMVRLRSHIEAVRNELNKGGSVGRKLDFLAQEMNREANTTLSKTTDVEISSKGVDLKTEIEKIREQIQNIE
ncbi:MAG: YicC family protein [Lachnospiraceae bacterium]|nr:YicC family protein [Lachnospiraceae bacterium]